MTSRLAAEEVTMETTALQRHLDLALVDSCRGEAESPVSSPAHSLAACSCDRDYRTHHHQVTILGPVDDGLLATLEVYEALSARLDVKANAAANIGMVSLLIVCCSFFFINRQLCTFPGPL